MSLRFGKFLKFFIICLKLNILLELWMLERMLECFECLKEIYRKEDLIKIFVIQCWIYRRSYKLSQWKLQETF